MSESERMSSVDTAWLRMDSSTNLMMIVGVHLFETAVEYSKLKSLIEQRLLKYNRFRQRVKRDPAGGAWWEDDPYFDLDQHLVRVALPQSDSGDLEGDRKALKAFVAHLASQRLDPGKPLWQFHLVENWQGTNVLVARIHHCIADGIALIGVLLSMTDSSEEADTKPHRDRGDDNFWRSLLRPMTDATVKAIGLTGDAVSMAMQAFSNPDRLAGLGKMAGHLLQDAAKIALMANDSETVLKGKPGVRKGVAWCEPLPLAEVKAVGKQLDASVNDVLLSTVAGAIRAYLMAHGDEVEGVEFRAMVPVNLRPPNERGRLGNKFGLVPLCLPVGIDDPVERVAEVHRRMEELKGGYQAPLAFATLGLVGLFPRAIQRQVLDFLARKASAVMTNVPGPQAPLYMAGSQLKQLMFWVPQSGDIGLGVSILSYNGGVQMGLIADHKLCPDPDVLIAAFEPEFHRLASLVAKASIAKESKSKSSAPMNPKAGAKSSLKSSSTSGPKSRPKPSQAAAEPAEISLQPDQAKPSRKPRLKSNRMVADAAKVPSTPDASLAAKPQRKPRKAVASATTQAPVETAQPLAEPPKFKLKKRSAFAKARDEARGE